MIRYLLIAFFLLFSTFLSAQKIYFPKHKIKFMGKKHFTRDALEEAIGVDNNSILAFWKKRNPRLKDKLIPSLKETLKSFYESEGFYEATFNVDINDTTLLININANRPIRVKSIRLTSDFPLLNLITFRKKDIFSAKTFVTIKGRIIQSLYKAGYCSYDLDTKAYVDLEKYTANLKYILRKKEPCTFGKLSFTGLKSIDEDVVTSRVEALEGKRFNSELVASTSDNLYGLHAFDSVVVNVDRKFYNVVPVDIRVIEMEKAYQGEVGAGYDTYLGPRVHGKLTKNNFLGNAQRLTLKSSWSKREQLLELSFFKPALVNIFGYYLDFGAVIGYSNLEYDGFQEKKAYTGAYLEYKTRRLKLRGGLAVESINIRALDNLRRGRLLERAVNEGDFFLFYPYIDYVYDARDSKLNPHFGYYLAGYHEVGLSTDVEASIYIKTLLEARLIHSFGKVTLATVGKVGIIDLTTENGLPESKFFFGGGSFSNRAYGYREMGVILSKKEESIFGASTMANLSFEMNYPLSENLYGAVFTDNTILTDTSYSFNGDVISAVGVGVRYMTPIGPFKLDVGFNVAKWNQYGISFQIGQSF